MLWGSVRPKHRMLLRLRRLWAVIIAFVLVLYFSVSLWITDTDIETIFYRVWYTNGFPNSSEAGEIACYYDTASNTLPELPTTVVPNSGIFFVETSCHSTAGVHLSPRQACAVESAAKMNPQKDVYVLFPGPVVDDTAALSPSVRQLLLYPNIRLRHINMVKYFNQTPLQEFYEMGQLRTSRWPRSHTSDLLRYLTLWKFGGIYLDLDVVITKSLSEMVNFAGAESAEDVAAGVLSFSHDGVGHEMAGQCVRDLRRNFRGYDWGSNGPGIITRLLKRVCSTEDVREMTPERCKGFTVFPPHTFYPIPWRQWKLYFNSTLGDEILRQLASSHAIHVWNMHSRLTNVTVGSRQPYGVIASQYCPHVYEHVGTFF